MIQPELKILQQLQNEPQYKTAPVSMEILSDIKTPIEVLKILKNVSSHCYLLESLSDHENWRRYTFLGFNPSLEISCQNGHMKVGTLSFETTDPGQYIRQVMEEHKSPSFPFLPPFTGGLVGYFSYDYLKYAEPTLNLNAADTEGFKDVDLMLFDKVIAFDNFRQKIILIINIELDHLDTEYNRAVLELKQLAELIKNETPVSDEPDRCTSDFHSLFQQDEFCSMIEKAKNILMKEIFFRSFYPTVWKQIAKAACLIPTGFSAL